MKCTLAANRSDAKNLIHFKQWLPYKKGLIIHLGNDSYPIAPNIQAVSTKDVLGDIDKIL